MTVCLVRGSPPFKTASFSGTTLRSNPCLLLRKRISAMRIPSEPLPTDGLSAKLWSETNGLPLCSYAMLSSEDKIDPTYLNAYPVSTWLTRRKFSLARPTKKRCYANPSSTTRRGYETSRDDWTGGSKTSTKIDGLSFFISCYRKCPRGSNVRIPRWSSDASLRMSVPIICSTFISWSSLFPF